MRLESTFTFQASHVLPNHPGPCHRLHGHGYQLTVAVEGEVTPATGMVIDFFVLDEIVRDTVLKLLDHRHLNEILEPPTTEKLVKWIWDRLEGSLAGLCEIVLREEPNHAVIYRG